MKMAENSFVPTRGSFAKNIAVQYKEVVYTNPSKKKKTDSGVKPPRTTYNDDFGSRNDHTEHNSSRSEFDIKRAKYEIKKFARTNSKSSNKQKTYRELAVELGARPLRKDPINYKELLQKKDKRKAKMKRREEIKKLGQMSNGRSMLKTKKKHNPVTKNRSGFLDVYGNAKSAARSA